MVALAAGGKVAEANIVWAPPAIGSIIPRSEAAFPGVARGGVLTSAGLLLAAPTCDADIEDRCFWATGSRPLML
jgi:hypothetical protein